MNDLCLQLGTKYVYDYLIDEYSSHQSFYKVYLTYFNNIYIEKYWTYHTSYNVE